MKTLNTWAPPVAISLLLHAAVIVLATQQLSSSRPVTNPSQSITVALLGESQAIKHKAQTKPEQPARPEPSPIATAIPQESPAVVVSPEQTSTPNQESNSATETKPSAVTIHPLSKLTRAPAFLHKIDPVYPVAEQRAGSQANVLAEVTIDDKGEVLEVRIIKSAGKHFDDAVIEALKKSMFVPGYINKEAVAVRVLVPFRFNLR